MIRRFLTLLLTASLVSSAGASQQHLVPPSQVEARLASAAVDRERNLRTVRSLLATELGSDAASLLRADVAQLQAVAVTLSDEELRDLAARAEALRTDPLAGDSTLLIIFATIGILLIILLIIGAIACSNDPYC